VLSLWPWEVIGSQGDGATRRRGRAGVPTLGSRADKAYIYVGSACDRFPGLSVTTHFSQKRQKKNSKTSFTYPSKKKYLKQKIAHRAFFIGDEKNHKKISNFFLAPAPFEQAQNKKNKIKKLRPRFLVGDNKNSQKNYTFRLFRR
jgi:hypothetical protein